MSSTGSPPESGRKDAGPLVVGVVSDTHGRLHTEVLEALEGVDHIIHAGDVGSPEVLDGLKALAPVTAVRGNCDFEPWAHRLPTEAELELGGVRIVVRHIGARPREHHSHAGGTGGEAAGTDHVQRPSVVISGHTHKADITELDGVLHLNPGSAGPQRFGRSRTIALLRISPGSEGVPARITAESITVSGEV